MHPGSPSPIENVLTSEFYTQPNLQTIFLGIQNIHIFQSQLEREKIKALGKKSFNSREIEEFPVR
jgi:hypothetical protein